MFAPDHLSSRRDFAFTLIELLIVIAVVGILASMALVILDPLKQRLRAKDAVTSETLNKIILEIRASMNSNTSGIITPPTCAELDAASNYITGVSCTVSSPGTFTISGLSDLSGSSFLTITYNWNSTDFCLSASAMDTSEGAFIKMDSGIGTPTGVPVRSASGC